MRTAHTFNNSAAAGSHKPGGVSFDKLHRKGDSMIATGFEEENIVMDTPDGVSPDDVQPLSSCLATLPNGDPVTISCWKPTDEEWEEMRRTGRMWVMIWGHGMPPIFPSGHTPFGERIQCTPLPI